MALIINSAEGKFVTNKNENHNNYQFIYKCLKFYSLILMEIKQLIEATPYTR